MGWITETTLTWEKGKEIKVADTTLQKMKQGILLMKNKDSFLGKRKREVVSDERKEKKSKFDEGEHVAKDKNYEPTYDEIKEKLKEKAKLYDLN